MMLYNLIYKFFRLLPIKRKNVLFIGYYGSQYGCNPKYISQELSKNHNEKVNIIWAFTNPTIHQIDSIKKVKYASVQYLYYLATSRIICTNYRMTTDFIKRTGQKYIQTWHSSVRLKKIEKDAEDKLKPHYVNMAKKDSAQIDYLIAGSKMSHDTFANSFWYAGKILDLGTPRNDIIIKSPQTLVEQVKANLSIPKDKKIVLYAPTFRQNNDSSVYQLDFSKIVTILSDIHKCNWIVLTRLHPHLIEKNIFEQTDYLKDVTKYNDIQELLLIADCLITDFSSLMFDFALSKKPVFLYAKDIDDYQNNERGLYFDIKKLPFVVSSSQDQLFNNIQNFNNDSYMAALKQFNNIIGSYEEGTASEKVADLIIKLTKK